MLLHLQQIAPSDQLIHGADAKLRHIFTELLSHKMHKVDHILRFAPKAFTKLRILSSDAHRTGVQITYTHHDTTHSYKRSCGKTKFLCAKHGRNGHIPASHKLSVGFQTNLRTQIVHDQCLVSLGKAKLPRKPRIMNGGSRSSPCTSVIAGNQNNLGSSFGNTCSDCTDAGFRDQFYGNPRIPIGIFKIINQLGQIFDGINIMVRRR